MHDQEGPGPGRAPAAAAAQDLDAGTVVAVLGDEVVVNVGGVLRRATADPELRLRVGDHVSIGDGRDPRLSPERSRARRR